ncbi:lytic transglycosylase domain-containing protein [Sulfuritalea hydrogenivorans]|uniref:Lytic transglycosylase subunit n=1 Tax=Sulfuritalea hydrogenivorans sk43H TaxID=1223802 RepID=W0SJI0_9PROT|nr:lytic transglycosylase domain-containing protein [Sulfuritalea hydrogenivorans]BAO31344.1 lytic transglycosylase subunit [Sulfuritalea hydrogenivorans sk43H]
MNYNPNSVTSLCRIGLVAATFMGIAVAPAPTYAERGDTVFLSAREAFRNGERVRLGRQIEALQGHPLQAWAEYWALRLRLDDGDESGVADYLGRYQGAYLAEKLRGDWLRVMGKKGDWESFRRELPALMVPDAETSCYAAQAANTPDSVRPYWNSGQDLPQACETLVDQMVAAGGLTVEEVWQRVRRLFEAKRVGAARSAAAYLPASEGFDGRGLESIAQSPARYFDKLPAGFAAKRGGREVALFAVQRLARNDPQDAAKRWSRIEAQFSAEERAYAWGQIAWQTALRHQPEALDWYEKAVGTTLSEEQRAWHVRAALRVHDWSAVRRAIGAMSPNIAAQPDWTYWLARALAAGGQPGEARALFLKIGGQPNFYGNLADEELGRTIEVPPHATPPSAEELAVAEANQGFRRALALFRVDMRLEGIREWAWALRGMDDRALLAAAEFARRHEIWDRAINTADRTLAQHNYGLRYIAPFSDQVRPKADQLALDNGWVYGLMRQESRFIMNAKSSVGAKGLMQLMPATAKWVAKKINLSNFHPARVTEMDTNVTLGTNYMKMVLDSLDNHPVLASAAYNAGPGRARKWRAEHPLEGAIYAETIPFSETRDYVKKVMSNAVYYNTLFSGRPQSLKSTLGVIGARGQGEKGVEELP